MNSGRYNLDFQARLRRLVNAFSNVFELDHGFHLLE